MSDKFFETLDRIQAEGGTAEALLKGDGTPVAKLRRESAEYATRLARTAQFVEGLYKGRYTLRQFREAMTTDDFPYLFGDIIDRQLLAGYQATPVTWSNYIKRVTVRDFRAVNRFTIDGGEAYLDQVPERGPYPTAALSDGKYTYSVAKFGRRMGFSFESMVNDDLDALKDIPARFGRAAARSEERFATDMFVGTDGPDGTFYASGNANVVTSNPALTITSLQTGMQILAAQTDDDGEPIAIDAVHLVVPPALEITGQNILNAIQLELTTEGGGTSASKLIARNWMANRVRLHVNYYIPRLATNNKNTSWFLFADPNSGRPAAEMGFLRGYEQPQVFMKAPNASRVGGGTNIMDGDFDSDQIEYKVRHIFGGTLMDPKMSVASQGDGS